MSQTLDVVLPFSGPAVTRDSFAEYVLGEILRTAGPQVPCPRAEEILTGFWDRFGPDKALLACSLAFGVHRGIWRSAQITPLRFAEHQDEFFAIPLLAAGDGSE
jgi:hypothetical protein